MTSVMTPSLKRITDGQIEKVVDVFRAALRARREEFSSEAAQHALSNSGLGKLLVDPLSEHVEALTQVHVRRVRVDRSAAPLDVFRAKGYILSVNDKVLASMPLRQEELVEVYFFTIQQFASAERIAEEYRIRGLVPDPYAQAAVNANWSEFACKYTNLSYWLDADGNSCCLQFSPNYDKGREGESTVSCGYENVYDPFHWIAGVRA